MYELSVAQELYYKSRTRADLLGARELERVRVAVGELSGVVPELLRAAWEFVVAESADDHCVLEIIKTEARQVCPQCGAVPEQHSYLAHCERCKCHMRVETGDHVELLEIGFQQELAMA